MLISLVGSFSVERVINMMTIVQWLDNTGIAAFQSFGDMIVFVYSLFNFIPSFLVSPLVFCITLGLFKVIYHKAPGGGGI